MATFDELVLRIDVATQKLEGDVNDITGFATNLETAVTDAQTSADAAAASAAEAANKVPEAPIDGKQYARKDATWTEVSASATDVVKSVNGKTPNVSGAVTLTYTDVGALQNTYVPTWASITGKPTVFPADYTQLSNKPTTFAPSAHTHDAADVISGTFSALRIPNLPANKISNASGAFALELIPVIPHTKITGGSAATADQYLAGDGTWKTPSGGGGTAVGFPISETGLLYNNVAWTNWPSTNPHDSASLALVKNTGGTITGNQFFTGGSVNVSMLPCGNYFITDALGAAGVGQLPANSIITVANFSTIKRATAFYQGLGGDTKGKMWVFRTSDSTWLPVNNPT